MKILFIITQSELGGAQRWVFDTATSLRKKGYEVMVAAGGNDYLLKSLQNQSSSAVIANPEPDSVIASPEGAKQSFEEIAAGTSSPRNDGRLKIRHLPHLVREISPLKDLLAILEIYRLIKNEQPDIIQLCSTKAGLLGAIAAKIAASLPRVAPRNDNGETPRDDDAIKIIYRIGGWAFNDPRPWWQKKIFFWIEKWSAPLKDKIIVNSRHDFEQALRLGIADKNKLILLYNGIDLSVIASPGPLAASEAWREAISPRDDDKIATSLPRVAPRNDDEQAPRDDILIGCIANFYPTKGLVYLTRAIALLNFKFQISNFKLIIVGDGKQRLLLEKLIEKYNLKKVVKLAGQKDNPWQYFADQGGVDIFVIPSVKEGMPYVLLEAMARGLPIIATKVGGIPEVIENGVSGLIIPPRDEKSLAEAINRLINNLQLREKLSASARQRVQDFSLEKMIVEYEKLISNLI